MTYSPVSTLLVCGGTYCQRPTVTTRLPSHETMAPAGDHSYLPLTAT
ncbi:MAG TPA: hypothetical protein VF851_09140 [Steroidobacteraceae bacterium]